MNEGQMVALQGVVAVGLPVGVALHREVSPVGEGSRFRPWFREGGKGAQPGEERGRGGIDGDEDASPPGRHADWPQSHGVPLEVFTEPRRQGEGAIELIGPAVVGTDEPCRTGTGAIGQQGGGTVAAVIVEGAQVSAAVLEHDNGPAVHRARRPGSRARHLVFGSEEGPVAGKDGVALPARHRR